MLGFLLLIWFWPYFAHGSVPLNTDYLKARFAPWNADPGRPRVHNYELDDAVLSYYPLRNEAGRQLETGHLPLWNPYGMCGTPLFEDQIAMPLALSNLLYLALPPPDAWTWTLMLGFLVAGLGMHRLLRQLEVRHALFGAGAFMLSTCLTQSAEWPAFLGAYCWLPWALWSVERPASWRSVGLGALFLTLMVWGGLSQLALYNWVLVLGLCLWRRHPWRQVAATFGLALAMSLVVIVPTAALVRATDRPPGRYAEARPHAVLTYVWRDCFGNPARGTYMSAFTHYYTLAFSAYVGLWTLLLAISRRVGPRLRPYAAMALLVPVYALLNPLVEGLPLFVVDHYRAAGITALGLATLGASALAERPRWRLWLGLALAGALVVLVLERVGSPAGPPSLAGYLAHLRAQYGTSLLSPNFGVPLLMALGLAAWSLAPGRVFRTGVAAFVLVDLLVGARAWIGWAPRPLIPETPSLRFLRENLGSARFCALPPARPAPPGQNTIGIIPPNVAVALRLRDARAYESVFPARQRRMTGPRPDLMGRLEHPEWALWDLFAIRYLVSDVPTDSLGWKLVHTSDLFVYENTDPCPRAFLTEGCEVLPTPELLARLWQPQEVRSRLLLASEDVPASLARPGSRWSPATLVRDDPARVEIACAAEFDGFLVLADTGYPGWKAYVDGQPAPILPAYSGLRAVEVKAGQHTVTFAYEPAWMGGWMMLALGALALAGGLVWAGR